MSKLTASFLSHSRKGKNNFPTPSHSRQAKIVLSRQAIQVWPILLAINLLSSPCLAGHPNYSVFVLRWRGGYLTYLELSMCKDKQAMTILCISCLILVYQIKQVKKSIRSDFDFEMPNFWGDRRWHNRKCNNPVFWQNQKMA
jgi:hypothetical protein